MSRRRWGYYDGGGDFGWRPYVSAAAKRRRAVLAVRDFKKSGRALAPVAVSGRKIATTFWGSAWCDNLERYSDYANRLPRGRTYVRGGCVIDLQITAGEVKALVSGSDIYEVRVKVAAVAADHWRSLCRACAGGIDSLVELLQGRFSNAVMQQLCAEGSGLFPTPREIEFTCSCPDWATMCKHVAAVLYGVGARLDHQPDLLFTLRKVNGQDLLAGAATAVARAPKAPKTAKVLDTDDLAGIFGVELAVPAPARKRAPRLTAGTAKSAKATGDSTKVKVGKTKPVPASPKTPTTPKALKAAATPRPSKPLTRPAVVAKAGTPAPEPTSAPRRRRSSSRRRD
jgi:uncharacterized Zn finger protein